LTQGVLEGLGDEAVGDVAEVELGLSERGAVGRRDEGACDLEEFRLGQGLEVGQELLGLGFLFGGEGVGHESIPDRGSGFLVPATFPPLVYKLSTN
jgi:hypothetical protein